MYKSMGMLNPFNLAVYQDMAIYVLMIINV